MPNTTPQVVPATAPQDAAIRNSGSTNAQGYAIVVHPDFSAVVVSGGVARPATVRAPQARWLFSKLRAAMPLDRLAGGGCMKSVSFGSRTTVTFGGTTSPDLSCGTDAAGRELLRTIDVIVAQLGVRLLRPVMPLRS